MFEIHFRRNYDTRSEYAHVGNRWFYTSLEEAKAARKVSGDLIVHRRTHLVVDDESWLFDWEKSDPNYYARKAMKYDAK